MRNRDPSALLPSASQNEGRDPILSTFQMQIIYILYDTPALPTKRREKNGGSILNRSRIVAVLQIFLVDSLFKI